MAEKPNKHFGMVSLTMVGWIDRGHSRILLRFLTWVIDVLNEIDPEWCIKGLIATTKYLLLTTKI